MKYLIPIILLSACAMETDHVPDYELARRAAISGYDSQVSPVSDTCYYRTQEYGVAEVDAMSMCDEPPEGFVVVGCVLHRIQMIYLYTGLTGHEKEDTAVHEYIHVLAQCETGDGDYYHENRALWEHRDSAETWGLAAL